MESAFELLVGKEKVDSFLNKHWGKSIYLNTRQSVHDINFTIIDLENLFSRSKLTHSDLRLSSTDQNIMPAQYCDEKGVVDIQRILFYFNRGSTIIIRSIENFNPWLLDLCFRLKVEFGNIKKIFVNLYLTPENSQGFFHHYDTEDVFILQIEGEKEWSLYNSPYPLPLETHPFSMSKHILDNSKRRKLTLQATDVLYIPRGMIHEAKSQNKMSCHLTISIVPFTWSDVILEYQKEYSYLSEFLRTSIPAKITKSNIIHLLTTYNKLNHRAINKVLTNLSNKYSANLKDHFNPANLLSKRKIAVRDSATITLNSDLFHGVNYLSESIELEVARIKILLPIEARSITEYIVKHKKCRIKDIPTQYPRKDKFAIVERLIHDSFIHIADM